MLPVCIELIRLEFIFPSIPVVFFPLVSDSAQRSRFDAGQKSQSETTAIARRMNNESERNHKDHRQHGKTTAETIDSADGGTKRSNTRACRCCASVSIDEKLPVSGTGKSYEAFQKSISINTFQCHYNRIRHNPFPPFPFPPTHTYKVGCVVVVDLLLTHTNAESTALKCDRACEGPKIKALICYGKTIVSLAKILFQVPFLMS